MRPPHPVTRALADVLDLGVEAGTAAGLLALRVVGARPVGELRDDDLRRGAVVNPRPRADERRPVDG